MQPFFNAVEVFDGFAVEISVDAALTVGDAIHVDVSGDANALERLFTGVHAVDTLSVGVDPNHLTELSRTPTLAARIPELVKLLVADQASAAVTGATGEIAIEARGAGAAEVGATAASLTVTAIDEATVTLVGDGPSLKISVRGAASVAAQGFRADTVVVDAQGSGSVVVCSAGALAVEGSAAAMVEMRCE
jgi:hypothetical protein